MYNATPYPLRSGAWGAKVASENVREGDRVTIRAKSGKTWPAVITRVFWSGDGSAIVATESADGGPRRGGSRQRRRTPTPRSAPAVTAAPKPPPPDVDDYVPSWVDDYAEDWAEVGT